MSVSGLRIVFVASLIWCLLGLGVLISWGFFGGFGLSGGILAVLGLALFGVAFGILRFLLGRKHERKLLLWCRRFGDVDESAGYFNRWHGSIIAQACRDRLLPVTLQDESVDMPPLVASALVLPVFLFLMPGALGSALWLFELPWFDTTAGKFAAFVVVVLGFTAPSVVAVMVARWLGTRRVAPGNVAAAARRSIGKHRSHSGMLVLSCESIEWQACVEELLGAVNLAVIDVTELSQSVAWEVEAATRKLGADCVLLLCTDDRLHAGVELDELDGCTVLRYGLTEAGEEVAAFTRTWQEDKHLLVDPDAALLPLGESIASAIRHWLERSRIKSG